MRLSIALFVRLKRDVSALKNQNPLSRFPESSESIRQLVTMFSHGWYRRVYIRVETTMLSNCRCLNELLVLER